MFLNNYRMNNIRSVFVEHKKGIKLHNIYKTPIAGDVFLILENFEMFSAEDFFDVTECKRDDLITLLSIRPANHQMIFSYAEDNNQKSLPINWECRFLYRNQLLCRYFKNNLRKSEFYHYLKIIQ